jgi:Tfp pilus assembly major pilin PilA
VLVVIGCVAVVAVIALRASQHRVAGSDNTAAQHNAQAIHNLDKGLLTRLEQSLDAIALDVERIGESQRFVTKLLGERPQNAAPITERHK